MSYRVTSIDHLMAHELLNLEGDFKGVNEPSITRVIPVGYSYASFLSALKRGAFYLLTDNPSIPLLLLNQDEQTKDEQKWLINPQASSELKVSTFSRFNHNATSSSFIANSDSTNTASKAHRVGEVFYPALPLPERSPEPLVSDEKPRRFDFEYNLAIAGDITTQHDYAGGSFHLEKTRQEGMLGEWTKKVSNGITYLKLFASVDEPKRLRHDIQSDISTPFSVSNATVVPRGSNLVNESYLVATPAVQVGERLGLPTQGYFYLFLGATLIQEYKILGEGKFSFYATKTTPSNLSDERAYRFNATVLLLHWKMHGELVTDQYILYLEEKITIEKLKSITSTWLDEHAYPVDVNAILGAISLDVLDKTTPKLPATEPQAINHPKNVLYEYPTTFLDDSNKVRALTWQEIVDNDTPVVRVKKLRTLRIGVFFDGTGQNKPNDEYKEAYGNKSRTNVARLFDAYPEQDGKSAKIYVSGVGTVDDITIVPGERNPTIDAGDDERNIGLALGVYDDTGAFRKWQSLLKRLADIIRLMGSDYNQITHIEFDVFGFSRGAALARHFINAAREGIPDYLNKEKGKNPVDIYPNLLGNEAYKRFDHLSDEFYQIDNTRQVSVRFAGLFDTVGSFYKAGNEDEGNFQLALTPDAAKTVFQICAKHEYRKNYPLTALDEGGEIRAFVQGNFYQEVLPGCHADVGGGYPSKTQYGRTDLPERLQQPVESTYNRKWVTSKDYNELRADYSYLGGSTDFEAVMASTIRDEGVRWSKKCQTEFGMQGEVKRARDTLHYYQLVPISNALAGLSFERMKQQGEAHGIQWVQRVLDEQGKASFDANNDQLVKMIWDDLKTTPLGHIESQWAGLEDKLLASYVHRPHDGVINAGYDSAYEKLVNDITRDENNQPQRKVFGNE